MTFNKNIMLSKKDAIVYLEISDKAFDNYCISGELQGEKIKNRWWFNRDELKVWKSNKSSRTIELTIKEYERCFEFAIRMVYGGLSLNGIRGQRSEVQAADDVILGILAEHAIKKFISQSFGVDILLDEEVHPEQITPQDFDYVIDNGVKRIPNIGVGVKASKLKSMYLVLGANEVEHSSRKSDVYIFARVDLPTDHLFRILRDHSFFMNAKQAIDKDRLSRKIEELKSIPVWICGFTYLADLEKVTSIPGQYFENGHRYVKSVAKMRNSDSEWREMLSKL